MEKKQTITRLAGGVFAGRKSMNLSVEGLADVPQEIVEPDPIVEPEAPEIGPPSEYTIIKAYDNGNTSLVYAPYNGDFSYSWKDDENGEPVWEKNTSSARLYLRYPRRESSEVYIQSTEEDPTKKFKYYQSGLENWIEDIICIENDEVSSLAQFGNSWGKDQEEPKYMTCLERPITIIGQDPEKTLSLDFTFQNSHLDQGLETFLFHYKDVTTWRIPFLFGNAIYNHDVSKWMKGTIYACAGLQTKNEYNFDLTKIENRCNNDGTHQDFAKTPYDYRPHIREYLSGPGAPDVPYEPIGVFHKYKSSSSTLEQGESYVSSSIKIADTDEEGVDTSQAFEIGDSAAIVTDYGEQLFFYKCTTIKNLTKGKQYNFEKILSNKTSVSSSSTQWKLYCYKGADVATKYTTSIEKKTAKWLNENEFEVQATLKNQSAENITVESTDGIVSSSEIAPLQTTTVTRVFENPEPTTTVTVNAKSSNSDATIEKEIDTKVVYHVPASENSYSYANTGVYTSKAGEGKIARSYPNATFYAYKTDMNGFVVGEDKKPAVDDHVICNGKEVRVGSVNWSSNYFYLKLYPLSGYDSEWYDSFSDGFGGETNWIEFL